MKRILSIFFCFALFPATYAQDYQIPLREIKKASTQTSFTNSISLVRMHFALDALQGVSVESKEQGDFVDLYFGKGYTTGRIGEPKLPAFKRLIQIPNNAIVSARVNGATEKEIVLAEYGISKPIIPNQPSVRKDQDVRELPFHYNKQAYQQVDFTDEPQIELIDLGTLRGIRIALLQVNPVQYNPVSGTIKVFNDIDVEISTTGGSNETENEIRSNTYSPYFEPIFSALYNPYTKGVYDENPDLTKYPTKMLIVSHRMFEDKLQPFVQWKTQKGFYVDVVYTDDIGTSSSSIKNFVHTNYNGYTSGDVPPTFLVLVGDIGQVPASQVGTESGKYTDLYYASVDGDQFPEMYYGRLSAETPEELENIISKIIFYEKYEFPDPTYLNNATLIAGIDNTWNPLVGEPTVKYATKNYFNSSNGFSTVWGYGVANDPSNPNNSSGYAGCYDDQRISVGFINYTAHCNQTSWADPSFHISDFNTLNNVNKYPLAIGNCCLSADFGYSSSVSIGESWIRAQNKGAVTYIGSSPNTYWYEDFYWAVGAFPIESHESGYVPNFEETAFGAYDATFHTQYLSASGLVFIGNLSVTEAHLQDYDTHSSPLYYWEAYNVIGDPSLVPYLTEAQVNTVEHPEILPIGEPTYQVEALPGSYVAISMNDNLHGAALVGSQGVVDVPIIPFVVAGDVSVVITRPQTQPFFATVPAATEGKPYVMLSEYTLNDPSGNSDSKADYGEEFTLDLYLKNVGDMPTQDVTINLVGNDEYFTLISNSSIEAGTFGIEEDNKYKVLDNALTFQLSNAVPNGYKASYKLEITDGSEVWISNLEIIANAPQLVVDKILLANQSNEEIDHINLGETAFIKVDIINKGKSDSEQILASLSSTSNNITVVTSSYSINKLKSNEKFSVSYPISASADVDLETIEILNLLIESGAYGVEQQFDVMIGKLPEYLMGSGETITTCLGRFYDSGGPDGDYSNYEDAIVTIYPDEEGMVLSMDFSYAFIESGSKQWDKLFIFDGIDTTASYFTGSPYSNDNGVDIGLLTATNSHGAITLHFTSDENVVMSGWEALLSCAIPEYKATFMVNNSQNEYVENATIQINGIDEIFVTNTEGVFETILTNGDYSFRAHAEGYNQYESTFQIAGRDVNVPVQLVVVGIDDNPETNVEIFPNPFSDNVTIKGIEGAKSIAVTNAMGQKVLVQQIDGEDTITIPTTKFVSGVYILSIVFDETKIISAKIIKP
jgi:hypothetical protein